LDHPGANVPPAALPPPSPFKPGGELPNPLPTGAHRVISTLTAGQMRKMMEGVVLFGTGKAARLNGYSSGGKTGTAQKIDPDTHHYSKTMHIASFAGIAPVNNPVIAVAVVLDSPKSGDYHGAAASAPVFRDVAQQILEYLGVPHDTEVHKQAAGSKSAPRVVEDDGGEHAGNIEALYSAANDLPNDDPLRGLPSQPAPRAAAPVSEAKSTLAGSQTQAASSAPSAAAKPSQTGPEVTIGDAKRLRVPSLVGLPMRKVIELAAAAGLEVQINGSGSVREQAPAAGTLVPPGTKIVVRCGR
jgi:cell division protein FtsI (penicillin-binding protein 3)